MSRILLVEDNADLAYGLRNNLEIEGYDVTVASDGEVGLQRALEIEPALIILDLMLPKLDGYRVLRAIREAGSQVPVLILTAKGEEADKVLGFRMGADDYVTKPFGVLELLARVRAVLRRTRNGAAHHHPEDGHRFGDIEVDCRARTVTKGDEAVSLTPKEFDLLVALLRRQGAVASRLELMKEVWGHRAAVVSRTVDTHVAELRRKLEDDASSPRHILTVWKAGYRLER
jgi:DNA-binding response OmpR family regulator